MATSRPKLSPAADTRNYLMRERRLQRKVSGILRPAPFDYADSALRYRPWG